MNTPLKVKDFLISRTTHWRFNYSSRWESGGRIIEREKITVRFWEGEPYVLAYQWNTEGWMEGPTPLIAAMRCYVASKLGDEVEVPEELTTGGTL